MSSQIKNHSPTNRNLLLLMILIAPLLGLVAFVLASRGDRDHVQVIEITAAVLGGWWLLSYAFIRWQRWRAHKHRAR